MIPRDVKSPTAPIPFHKLLRIVAIVDRDDEQTKQLLDHIEALGPERARAMAAKLKMNLARAA